MNFKELKNISKPILIFILIIFATYVVVVSVGYLMYAKMDKVEQDGVVYIPTGTELNEQAKILVENGFLKDTTEYIVFAKKMNLDKVYPGKYTLKKGMSYKAMMRVIATGSQTAVNLTFNNVEDKESLAKKLASQIELDSATIINILNNDSLLTALGTNSNDVLYYFIPNSYQVYWNVSGEKLIERMMRESDKFWNSEQRKLLVDSSKLSKNEILTLASIVDKESNVSSEKPLIAGVYLKRLKLGIPLQADPTVKFALGDRGLKRILHKHLKVDSPYNTYKYRGLPPAPICVPSISAIDAVLNADTEQGYLYFCASDSFDGTHRFAKTLNEHNKNAKLYAAALNKIGIK